MTSFLGRILFGLFGNKNTRNRRYLCSFGSCSIFGMNGISFRSLGTFTPQVDHTRLVPHQQVFTICISTASFIISCVQQQLVKFFPLARSPFTPEQVKIFQKMFSCETSLKANSHVPIYRARK